MTRPAHTEVALDFLKTLVEFDTTSRESNLGLIEFVRDHLQSLGISTRLSYDADSKKANLFATLGDVTGRGIVLTYRCSACRRTSVGHGSF